MTLDLLRLKAERVAKGLSQDEMARKMGWKTRTPYAKRENGIVNIGADELVKMASILGYSKNELVFFLQLPFPKENVYKGEILMKTTLKTLTLITTGLVVGVVVGRVRKLEEKVKQIDLKFDITKQFITQANKIIPELKKDNDFRKGPQGPELY